jgi:hypothetical protein
MNVYCRAIAFAVIPLALALVGPMGPSVGRCQAAVDEDLFTLHTLQDLYFTWPTGSGGTDSLVSRLRRIDATLSRLKAAATVRQADTNLLGAIEDFRSRVRAYEQYLRSVGAIHEQTRIAAGADAVQTIHQAYKVGVAAGDLAVQSGYTEGQSAGTAGLVAFGAALIDGQLRSQERTAIERTRIDAANDTLRRECEDLFNQTKARISQLSTQKKWSTGAAGLDGFTARSWTTIIERRPNDLFAKVRRAAIPGENETQEAVFADAQVCVAAARQVPAGEAYDEFRGMFMATAVDRAAYAAVLGLKDGCYSSAPSKHAEGAAAIVREFMSLPAADASFGNYHLARIRAASGDVPGAIAAANAVDSSHRDLRFKFYYAKLASMVGDCKCSLDWLRSAFASGHEMVKHARTSPDFKNLRDAFPNEFLELTTVKSTWSIGWGFRIDNDTITLTNKSAFPLTNVALVPEVTCPGYADWSQRLTCDRLAPGDSVTWKVGVAGISARGDSYRSTATLYCDQQ